jgi:lysophospholipase L1-like esterase
MRSDPFPAAHPAGTLRILFVGDSIPYGTTRVDQRGIFTEILHRDLPAVVKQPVEILNASAGAWAPDNELSYLRSRGLFHADLVVLVLNNGDLTQPRATVAEVGDDLPLKRPATAIGEFCSRYLRPRMMHWLRHGDAGDAMAANADRVTRKNLADLDEIQQLAAAQRARLVIAYLPFRRDIPQPASAAEASFKAWADAHHVPMFDLTSAELPYSVGEITLDNGVHFNDRGNAVVAHAMEQSWQQVVGSR